MALGHNELEKLEPETLHTKSQRSMKFGLYMKTQALRTTTSEPTSAVSDLPPRIPPLPLPSRESPELYHSYGLAQRPSTSHNPEPPRSFTSSTVTQIPLERPSTASRIRALKNGHRSPPSERGLTPEPQSVVENFSRPRQASIKRRNGSPQALQNASTSPLEILGEDKGQSLQQDIKRDRGYSTSSQSTANYPAVPLRPSASIPDLPSVDSVQLRQRNPQNSAYRSLRGLSRPDSNYSSFRREPLPRPTGNDGEQVRASFRSALTTNSSFVASGTERSSVVTKSSSATSIFGKDEGMSVDDAIGMYEVGFHDSAPEDNYEARPGTSDSQRKRISKLEEAMNEELKIPEPRPCVRKSTSIPNTFLHSQKAAQGPSNIDGSLDIQESYFEQRPPTRSTTQPSMAEFDNTRDRYGFRKQSQNVTLAQYEIWNGPYSEHLSRRRKKWVALMKENGLSTENLIQFPPQTAKVKRFVRKGIPPDWRGNAWFFYAGGPVLLAKHRGVFAELVHKAANGGVSETDIEIIERDLNRTFPDNLKYKPDPPPEAEARFSLPQPETPMLQSLRRVLQTFAIYNPRIGYCQSLNFLAGLLLLFMDEEKAFWMLNLITRRYLPGTHEVNLEGANVDLGVLMTSIKESMPTIWAKIGGELDGSAGDGRMSMRLPPIMLCTTAWFMSCFIGTLPIETTLRVWDCFFYEGSKTLFGIALAIFKFGEQEIKAVNDPMEIFQVVQTIPRRLIDANALLEACFKRRNGFGHLSQDTIDERRAERRAGYAEERAKANGEIIVGRKKTIFSTKKRSRGKMDVG